MSTKRAKAGRALFYTRDPGGRHETTPGEYVRWAQRVATEQAVAFAGIPEQIERMIREGRSQDGDLFLDYGVTGNKLSRAGLDALLKTAHTDPTVSHVLIPRRDRLARPDDPVDALKIENQLLENGLTLVLQDRVCQPTKRGRHRDVGELIVAMIDYNSAGEFRRELAQKMIYSQIALAKLGFSVGGRPPYGFRRWWKRHDTGSCWRNSMSEAAHSEASRGRTIRRRTRWEAEYSTWRVAGRCIGSPIINVSATSVACISRAMGRSAITTASTDCSQPGS